MSPDIVGRQALRNHEHLQVVDQLRDLGCRLFVGLVLGGHPYFRCFFDDLLADAVHSEIEFGNSRGALWSRNGFLAELSEQRVEGFHASTVPDARHCQSRSPSPGEMKTQEIRAPRCRSVVERRRFREYSCVFDVRCWLLDPEQVDHEGEGAAGEAVSAARGAVCKVGRADELATTADLHARDAVLPALDES